MIRKQLHASWVYAMAFVRWVITGVGIGALCGLVGGLFAMAVEAATHLREQYPWLLYLLPLGGVCIAGIYRVMKLPLSLGTDEIISTVRSQEHVPVLMAPAIFLSTVLTHLLGGSAGREGAALQLGGSLGAAVGDLTHPKGDSRRICELCGMAALFSALFGTPLTAAVFVMEVIEVGHLHYRAFMPCAVSAVAAALMARLIGAPQEPWHLASGLQSVDGLSAVQALGVGIACALVSILFCAVMHLAGRTFRQLVKNDFLRMALGGAAVVVLSLALGTRDYNGGGMGIILAALDGQAKPWAFALKLLMTALTLSAGFKGGEIVPSFFVGATLGCTVAGLLGMSPALGAALGLAGVFCGVTNAPISAVLLSAELFGTEYLPLFGVTAAVSFMLSGHFSLYHAQLFAEPKLGHEE